MSNLIIRAENLGKKFQIGSHQPYHRFSELISGLGAAALNAPRRLLKTDRSTSAKTCRPSEFWALRDLNFEIHQGDVVGLIGRNGAGKSTLLKILSRITEPTTGRFGLKGRVASLLEVGTGFHPELTGRENIFLSGCVLGMSRAEIRRQFDAIVDFAGVEQFLDTPVKRYSSGMQVRLGFAVAAHLEPEILIIDEVLAVGDAEFQKKCLGKMGEVAHSGRTILFVSHNMQAIRKMCSRCLFLQGGKLIADSFTDQAIHSYQASIGDQSCDQLRRMIETHQHLADPHFLLHDLVVNEDSGLNVSLLFSIHQDCQDLRIHCDVQDSRGEILFRSFHDEQQSGITSWRKGDYRLTFQIPEECLQPGRYLLRLGAGFVGGRHVLLPQIEIPLELTTGSPLNKNYPATQNFGAFISPARWSLEDLSTEYLLAAAEDSRTDNRL